ncbi:MAG: heme exporter protein CcmD [Betaproteobacteria bacterium]|nr:heme exporter protein CcmD [Betaproteobacteria bacterium]MBI2961328.1 heme exporter protein CcmD [Betaproteobacteria bacterium]
MSWNSATEFFAMGGYAFYVWGSFGIAAILMAGEMLLVRARRRAAFLELGREIVARRAGGR